MNYVYKFSKRVERLEKYFPWPKLKLREKKERDRITKDLVKKFNLIFIAEGYKILDEIMYDHDILDLKLYFITILTGAGSSRIAN